MYVSRGHEYVQTPNKGFMYPLSHPNVKSLTEEKDKCVLKDI